MHKLILLLACFFILSFSFSQQSDFLSFRKNNRTIKNYFKGMPMEFVHVNGSYISGIIKRIYHDTLYMIRYDIRMSPTPWDTRMPDTVGHFDLEFHYNEIGAIPRDSKGFEFVRNGSLFMIGGVGYAFLHTFNGLVQKREIYPATLGISGGVALLGFTMRKLRKYYFPVGQKYKMEYIKITSS